MVFIDLILDSDRDRYIFHIELSFIEYRCRFRLWCYRFRGKK
jgi:hypothetical protein